MDHLIKFSAPIPSRWLQALFVQVALLCLAGAASAGEPVLRGTVTGPDGAPLAGIELRLFDRAAPEFSPEHLLDSTVSAADGGFELRAGPEGPFLIKLTGEAGTGRVALPDREKRTEFDLVYPVRTKVVFLHDNDLHFNFNHREAFEARVEVYRENYDNVFLLNAGDIFIRHPHRWPDPDPEDYLRRARQMIGTMNELGYDAMAVGNHELHYVEGYTREALDLAEFPLLGANIDIDTDRLPQLDAWLALETAERYSIALLGLSVVNFEAPGVADRDPIATARDHRHLAGEHDLFVALTHLGFRTERRLAQEVAELDAIIGGHSHTLLNPAETINGVLVAQAGGVPPGHPVHPALPKYLGVVKLVLENGRVVEKSGVVETFH